MKMVRVRRGYLIVAAAALFAVLLIASGGPVGAQLPTPIPSLSPIGPGPGPSPSPSPNEPAPPPGGGGDGGSGGGGGGSGGNGGGAQNSAPPPAAPAVAPSSSALPGSFPLVVPAIARTPSRNTSKLIQLLTPLTDRGMPLEEAMVMAAAPFPVAGTVWYSDDWLFPRIGPPPHLHEGTDIFAPMGTPIVASSPGIISGKSEVGLGGTSLWVAADDGTGFYYTHLSAYAEGIEIGSRVDVGTVIGYVGNTGNAITTSPHLHFEIHPAVKDPKGRVLTGGVTQLPNGLARTNAPAVNPKPILDVWLLQAEVKAQQLVIQFIERFAQISRQLHFVSRVDQLYTSDVSASPREMFWFSVFDPTLAAIGMARQASAEVTLSGAGGSMAFNQAEEARLNAVRMAVDAPKLKLSSLSGELEKEQLSAAGG